MITDRPCTCGCSFGDHAKQEFSDKKPTMYYCRNCCGIGKPSMWCIEYTPIDNLKFLEWKDEHGS